ncbi:hypothetical protein DCM83_12565 [Bradyrhizobium betae]|uniref:Uncharacterized protein n=1 Tax=Bradyrhizobium betae TaxID=244734 RepID=A0AAE9NAI4_9BRAD|nr:hypothetical protein [Bradyrhizobium sp. WBOS16]UUO65950.1 hypothetical protein DCM83_12565 [Bradyrhizobium betae]
MIDSDVVMADVEAQRTDAGQRCRYCDTRLIAADASGVAVIDVVRCAELLSVSTASVLSGDSFASSSGIIIQPVT